MSFFVSVDDLVREIVRELQENVPSFRDLSEVILELDANTIDAALTAYRMGGWRASGELLHELVPGLIDKGIMLGVVYVRINEKAKAEMFVKMYADGKKAQTFKRSIWYEVTRNDACALWTEKSVDATGRPVPMFEVAVGKPGPGKVELRAEVPDVLDDDR